MLLDCPRYRVLFQVCTLTETSPKTKLLDADMRSEANSVEEYLAELPDERGKAISAVRDVILENLPEGYDEVMNWGMITYEVPLATCPDTYNGNPLMYAALASQKNHMAVYLTAIYMSEDSRKAFEHQYRATGKRMDVGKSCVRFRKLDNLPLSLIGEVVASTSVSEFVRRATEATSSRKKKR